MKTKEASKPIKQETPKQLSAFERQQILKKSHIEDTVERPHQHEVHERPVGAWY